MPSYSIQVVEPTRRSGSRRTRAFQSPMRKSKSLAPSRSGAAGADAPEDGEGCCGEPDTPGAGDSCAVNDNKLSCSVATIQIERDFTGLGALRGRYGCLMMLTRPRRSFPPFTTMP